MLTKVLFLTVFAPVHAYGTEPANMDNAIKVAVRNGRDVISIDAKSSMGKRLSDWRDSLPVNTAFTVDGADYATAKLVYFPDGTRINIRADGKIVFRKTSNLLSPQMSATFGKDDVHIVVIRSLIAEIEKDNKETK